MNSQSQLKSDLQEDAVSLLGSSQQAELDKRIRILVWNSDADNHAQLLGNHPMLWDELSARTKCGNELELVLLHESCATGQSDDRAFDTDKRYEWAIAAGHEHLQTGVVKGVRTGCVAVTKEYVLHSAVATHLAPDQNLLLETHYALESSKQSLMVLNMYATNVLQHDDYLKQLERLQFVLDQHTGPVMLAGDFDSLSEERFALFQVCTAQAQLFEASITSCSSVQESSKGLPSKGLAYVFFRGMSLHSIEALSRDGSENHSPILVTVVTD